MASWNSTVGTRLDEDEDAKKTQEEGPEKEEKFGTTGKQFG